jgi:predicted nucleic acid-binding protein
VIFVDTNIPMYLIGRDHPHKLDAQHTLERLTGERRRLVTSSEVFQEILHRYLSTEHHDKIERAFELLRGIVDDVLAVDETDVLAAKDVVHANRGFSARDALHIAVMRRHQIAEILSFDSGFDKIAGIRRLPSPSTAI